MSKIHEELSAILKAIIGLTERIAKLEQEKCQCKTPSIPFDDEDCQKIW